MSNIFSIFLNSSSSDKILILIMSLLYGILSPQIMGVALWFQQPTLLCPVPTSSPFSSSSPNLPPSYEYCSESEACSSKNYLISASGPLSLSSILSLVCEDRVFKRIFTSSFFFGNFLGCVFNVFVTLPTKHRKFIVAAFALLNSFTNFLMVMLFEDKILVSLIFLVMAFSWIILFSNSFLIVNENFNPEVAKAAIIFMVLVWGVFGGVMTGLAFLSNSDFRVLFWMNGVFMGISGVLLLWKSRQGGARKSKKEENKPMKALVRDAFSFPQIRYNLLAYIFIWAVYATTYNDVFLSLQTVGGNIYINLLSICVLEIIGSFVAAWITQKFEVIKVLNLFYCFITILGGLFLFAPIDNAPSSTSSSSHSSLSSSSSSTPSSSSSFFYLLCLLGIKLSADILNSLINVLTPSFFTDDYIIIYISFSRLASRIFLFSLPTINFLLELNSLHSFVFLFILWAFCKLLSIQTKEVKNEENLPQLMNELKIEISDRMSLITTSQFEGPSQVLKGIDLSEVRLSRKKSRFGMEMEDFGEEKKRKLLDL